MCSFIFILYQFICFADLMDPDLKAALFEDDDEEGDFEELNDDFISQVSRDG